MRYLGCCVLVGLSLCVSANGADKHPRAHVVKITLGPGMVAQGPFWLRVGQPLLVRVAADLKPLAVDRGGIVGGGNWRVPDCSPSHCYALVAKRPGRTTLIASARCGLGAACVAWSATVYVEPAVCEAGVVSALPADRPPRQVGSLRAMPLPGRGAGAQPFSYTLARFSDSATAAAPSPDASLYVATVDWGDGSPEDSGGIGPVAITRTKLAGFLVVATHFYCHAGTHTATIRIDKPGSWPPHPADETVTVRVKMIVRGRPEPERQPGGIRNRLAATVR